MRVAPLLLVALAGCKALFGLDDAGDRDPDATPIDDADDPLADARLCWGTDIEVCIAAPPASAITDLSGAFDTDTAGACDGGITPFCVVAGTDVTVPAGKTLTVTGGRPLVVLAFGTLRVAGTIDAASRTGKPGPASSGAGCNAFAGNPSIRGGGAGGSFGGLGGPGAGADQPDTGNGGTPAAIVQSITFRGGCAGQNSGNPSATLGVGGLGGGAVYLIAGTAIDIADTGRVNASGSHGAGGDCRDAGGTDTCANSLGNASGGGGGGAGGMIVLESAAVTIAAGGLVFADGGAGGEGSSRTFDGSAGLDPNGTASAPGGGSVGTDISNGGNGGNGSHALLAATAAGLGDDPGGGGGGGGGAGVVRVHGTLANSGTISP